MAVVRIQPTVVAPPLPGPRITVHVRNCSDPELAKSDAERRVRLALGRFSARVVNLIVRIDGAGTDGSRGTRCRVRAGLRDGTQINVESVDAPLETTIKRAADRLQEKLAGHKRRRVTRRRLP